MLHDILVDAGELLRLCVILIGFVAMWSLWVARDERGKRWTSKMRDIWICHMLFVAAAVESNIEHLYRHNAPTVSTALLAFILIWTVKSSFNGELYTKDDCEH